MQAIELPEQDGRLPAQGMAMMAGNIGAAPDPSRHAAVRPARSRSPRAAGRRQPVHARPLERADRAITAEQHHVRPTDFILRLQDPAGDRPGVDRHGDEPGGRSKDVTTAGTYTERDPGLPRHIATSRSRSRRPPAPPRSPRPPRSCGRQRTRPRRRPSHVRSGNAGAGIRAADRRGHLPGLVVNLATDQRPELSPATRSSPDYAARPPRRYDGHDVPHNARRRRRPARATDQPERTS